MNIVEGNTFYRIVVGTGVFAITETLCQLEVVERFIGMTGRNGLAVVSTVPDLGQVIVVPNRCIISMLLAAAPQADGVLLIKHTAVKMLLLFVPVIGAGIEVPDRVELCVR